MNINSHLSELKNKSLNVSNQSPNQNLDERITNLKIGALEISSIAFGTIKDPIDLNHCALTEDEICQNTLLVANVNFPPLMMPPEYGNQESKTLRFFANALAGGLITGGKESHLDGFLPLANFQAWRWALNGLEDELEINERTSIKTLMTLRKGIDQLYQFSWETDEITQQTLQAYASKFATRVNQLQINDFYLMYGGWSNIGGGDGHAVIYEFRKVQHKTFDIIIHTSTGFQVSGSIYAEGKERLKPLVHYKDVPEEKLFFNSDNQIRPIIFQSFLELRCLQKFDNNFKVEEEDILEILDQFEEYRVPVPVSAYGAITGQRAGTCLNSSTKAWIRSHCPDINVYRQIMFHIKLKFLIAAYASLKDNIQYNTSNSALNRKLLEHVARKLLRRVAKLKQVNLISDNLSLRAIATAHDILNKISTITKKLEEALKLTKIITDIEVDIIDRRQERSENLFTIVKSMQDLSMQQVKLPELKSIEDCNTFFELFDPYYTQLSFADITIFQKEYQITITHHIVDQLPIPSANKKLTIFDSLSTEDKQAAADLLLKVMKHYYTLSSEVELNRIHATILPLNAMIHYLCHAIEKDLNLGILRKFNVPYHGNKLSQLKNVIYLNRFEFERISSANAYFYENEKNNLITIFNHENSTTIEKDVVMETNNGLLWKELWIQDEELNEELEKIVNLTWKDFTPKEIEDNYNQQLNLAYEWDRKNQENEANKNDPLYIYKPIGSRPIPIKLVNLPLDQKKVMYLEGNIPLPRDPNVIYQITLLDKFKKSYIHTLREACYFSGESVFYNLNSNLSIQPEVSRVNLYSYDASVTKRGSSSKTFNPKIYNKIKQEFLIKTSDEINGILNENVASRNPIYWNKPFAEGKSLNLINNPLSDKLMRLLSAWKLAPYQFLYELEKDFDQLGKLEVQTLFYQLFFRSPISNENIIKLGVGKLLAEELSLQEKCKTFIAKGLEHFNKTKLNRSLGAKFFFEIALLCEKYLIDAGLNEESNKFCFLDSLNQWILKEDLSNSERAIFHFYRVLAFSTKIDHLASNDLSEIFVSHSFYQIYLKKENGIPVFMENLEKEFIKRLLIKLQNEKELYNFDNIYKDILSTFGIKVNASCTLEKFPLLESQESSWKIDLYTGYIFNNSELLAGVPFSYPWENSEIFQKLFGEPPYNFEYVSIGINDVIFNHPQMGAVKIIKNNNKYYLQRKFSESDDWYQFEYKNNNDIKLQKYPSILFYGHFFWAAPVGTTYKAIITDNVNHLPKFVLGKDENFYEVDKNCKITSNSHVVDGFIPEDPNNGLLLFDGHILTYEKNGRLQKVQFPRFVSQEGNSLVFIKQKDRLIWNDNKQYHIVKETPQGYFGTINNYLLLISSSKDDPKKFLVPMQPVKQSSIPVANGNLNINNDSDLELEKNQKEKWGEITYFVYNLVNEKVVSTTEEGTFFLAYLELSQKNFAESIRLLKSIKDISKLSKRSTLIKMILELPYGEDDPNAIMVRMHVLLMLLKNKDAISKEKVAHFFENDQFSMQILWGFLIKYHSLTQSLNNVSNFCKFSEEEEVYFLNKLIKETKFHKIALTLQFSLKLYTRYLNNLYNRYNFITNKFLENKIYNEIDGLRKLPESGPGRFRGLFMPETKGNPGFDFTWRAPNISSYKYKDASKTLNPHWSGESYFDHSDYNTIFSYYMEAVNKFASWLNNGRLPIQTTRLDKNIDFNNGKLFLEVNRIAFTGNSSEKAEMLFKLKMYRLHSEKNNIFCDLLIAMLQEPKFFPHIKSSLTDVEKYELVINFYNKLNRDQNRYAVYSLFTLPPIDNAILKVKHSTHVQKSFIDTGKFPIQNRNLHKKRVSNIQDQNEIVEFSLEKKINLELPFENWKSKIQYFEKEIKRESDFDFYLNKKDVSIFEYDYESSLERDFQLLEMDYQKGKEINLSEKDVFISSDDCKVIMTDAIQNKIHLETNLNEKLAQLFKLINIKSSNLSENIIEKAKIGGLIDREYNYNDALRALLVGTVQEYTQLNPHLTLKEIELLAELTLEISDIKSTISQLKRIENLTQRISKIDLLNDIERNYLCERLDVELKAKNEFSGFDNEIQIALRIFSGETGIIPFEKQINLIKKMIELSEDDEEKFKDIVIQLIMGGGKTSVLATILLFLAAKRKNRIGLFIVPASLFETVKANLGESLEKAFKIILDSIEISREDMTQYRLEQILNQIHKGKETFSPIIMKATTLQGLELEFLSQARTYKKICSEIVEAKQKLEALQVEERKLNENAKKRNLKLHEKCNIEDRCKDLKSKIEIQINSINFLESKITNAQLKLKPLSEIVTEFPKCSDALIDEVDLILDSLQEVNFPSGDKITVKSLRNSLLLHIFKVLLDENIKIDSISGFPNIKDFVGLHTNKQSNLNTTDYLQHIVPILAKNVAQNFKAITSFIEGYESSYLRFVSGTVPEFVQDFILLDKMVTEETLDEMDPKWRDFGTVNDYRTDVNFLKYLEMLYYSNEEEQTEAANLISLTRHFLIDLLPSTLSKSAKRNYGLKPNAAGTIIPYLAVDTPATTEFGYHWEAACYYYQWASFKEPSQDLIKEIAKKTETTARYYVQKNGELFHETVEYQEFMRLFGVPLDKINDAEVLEEARINISKDINKCLDLQFEIISTEVGYNPERLTSNGMGLIGMLSSKRAMSGTPWNVDGYSKSMKERYYPDLGTEGRILHTLAMRQKDKKIFTADLSSVENFFMNVYKDHPFKKNIRGVIDAGGIFKAFKNNKHVAKGYMKFLEKYPEYADENIEGVLFFYKDPGQSQSDTLYIWKKNGNCPERIGGSSIENLKAKGLNPKNYVVIYDERHTTGVDILQVPDAINIFTFDEKMLRRMIGQGIMRLRQFLISQNIEIVLTEEAKKSLINEGRTYNDLILSAEKVQSIRKTHDLVKYYIQQIDSIFRRLTIEEIAAIIKSNSPPEVLVEIVHRYEKFVVTYMDDVPYLQFGRLKRTVDTKDYLKIYLRKQLQVFRDAALQENKILGPNENIFRLAHEKSGEMENHIENAVGLPQKWKGEAPDHLHVEQEVEMNVDVAINNEIQVNNEIETEVELELQRYDCLPVPSLINEDKLTLKMFKALLQEIRSQKPNPSKIISLKNQLKKFSYGFHGELIPYEDAFSQPIFGTTKFFNTCESVLPVFHKLQRPSKQILAIEYNDSIRWLLLSEKETNHVKKHLKILYSQESNLVNGVWLIQPDGTPLINDKNYEDFPLFDDEISGVDEGLLEINAFAGNADYLDAHASDTEDWLKTKSEIKIRFLKLKVARDKFQNETLRRSQCIVGSDSTLSVQPDFFKCQARIEKEKHFQGNYIPSSAVEAKLIHSKKVKNLKVEFVKYLGIDPNATDEVTLQALEILDSKIPKEIQGIERKKELHQRAMEITQSQFNSLRKFHGSFITREQIKWLPSSFIEILDHPEQICIIDNTTSEIKEYLLGPEQVGHLKPHQKKLIPFINPKHYFTFRQKWQIEAVPPKDIDQVHSDCLQFLSKEQMKALTGDQVSKLKGKNIPPQKWSWLHGNFLAQIPPQFHNYVTSEQINEIDNATLINLLELIAKKGEPFNNYTKGKWVSQIHPDMVTSINFETNVEYIKYFIEKKHILRIPKEYVCHLDKETQVPLIGKNQVNYLTEVQIENCPNALVRYLEIPKLELLKPFPHKFAFLHGKEQIGLIRDQEIFNYLIAVNDPTLGYINQMQWIDESQYDLLTIAQVKGLSNIQMLDIKEKDTNHWDSINDGIVKDQSVSFNTPELFDLLSSKGISALMTLDQIGFLRKGWQVKSCPNKFVSNLNPRQIKKISNEQVPYLQNKKVKFIAQDKVRLLKAESAGDFVNQMIWISSDQLPYIQKNQVKGLKKDQLIKLSDIYEEEWAEWSKEITLEQVKTFDDSKYFNLLNCNQIAQFISKEQVAYLETEEHIQALGNNENLISGIIKSQFVHLTEEQIKLLNKEQINHFDEKSDLFNKISKVQLNSLSVLETLRRIPVNLVKDLTYSQFSLFQKEDKALIQELSNDQVSQLGTKDIHIITHLKYERIASINNSVLKHVGENKEFLKHVNSKKLHYLNIKQIKVRNFSKGSAYAKHVFASIGKMIVFPFMIIGKIIYNLALSIFSLFRALFVPNKINGRKLKMKLKKTFIVDPAIDFLTIVQLFNPVKFMQLKSKLVASAA